MVQACGDYVYKEVQMLWQWVHLVGCWKHVLLHWKNTMRYSMEERVFVLTEYITLRSFVPICEAFKNEFPDSEEPPSSTIPWLFQKLLNTGSVFDHPRARIHTAWMTANRNHISDSVDDAPRLSTRRRAQSLNLSQVTIQHLLERIKAVLVPFISASGIETIRLSTSN